MNHRKILCRAFALSCYWFNEMPADQLNRQYRNRLILMTGSHSFLILLMIFVNLMNGIKKLLVGDVFFLKEHTESLFLE